MKSLLEERITSYIGFCATSYEFAKNKCGIYGIYNQITHVYYIGSAINIWRRWSIHKSLLRNNKHYNKYLQKDWNQYRENNFTFSILETFQDNNELLKKEQIWIDRLSPEYNIIKIIGKSFFTQFPNGRLCGKNHPMFGRKRLDTALYNKLHKKNKSYEEQYGIERAKEIKLKIGIASRRQSKENHYNFGTGKPVLQLDINNHLIKKHINIRLAAQEIGIHHNGIYYCCRGKQKTAGGFIWKYD